MLKLTFKRNVFMPQLPFGAFIFPTAKAKAKGVALAEGEYSTVYMTEAGVAPGDIQLLRVSSGTTITGCAGGNFTGATSEYGAGEHLINAGSLDFSPLPVLKVVSLRKSCWT
ncbi:hypothetical protein S7711_08481 [Stachybotrys chartarum IBT 7711]|uniref:Uncharacterized protein n=1 Tax=Stachybotrys chartarum (strain CBS 109288 / IBT 7711) TaxID=1280523 RepID=A0A084BCM9_STACB|nr:hypothetical protein S7711_08481 [Stachybotrys chartarum IBT 7711]